MASGKVSAGLLLYRRLDPAKAASTSAQLEVLLAHPGGPFFAKKDAGAWSIPKGEPAPNEDLQDAARREFSEEIGLPITGPLLPLGEIRQKAGKVVHAWAFEGEVPPNFSPTSNLIELEWPPRSGRRIQIPEVDRAELFPLAVALQKINPAQQPLLERLQVLIG